MRLGAAVTAIVVLAGGRRALAASRDGSAGQSRGPAYRATARRPAAGVRLRIPCAGLSSAPTGRLRGSRRIRPPPPGGYLGTRRSGAGLSTSG